MQCKLKQQHLGSRGRSVGASAVGPAGCSSCLVCRAAGGRANILEQSSDHCSGLLAASESGETLTERLAIRQLNLQDTRLSSQKLKSHSERVVSTAVCIVLNYFLTQRQHHVRQQTVLWCCLGLFRTHLRLHYECKSV